jgi:hypothetical protein
MKWIALPVTLAIMGWALAAMMIEREGTWKRPNPLHDPVQVTDVRSGELHIENDRIVRPAGISPSVPNGVWDKFLSIATAQGIVIDRHLEDGTAVIQVEAKFYNWCGTSSRRWAGTYVSCDLSVLAVRCGYAEPLNEQVGLDDLEAWRIDGARALRFDDEPVVINEHLNAFRFNSLVYEFQDLDQYIESVTETSRP